MKNKTRVEKIIQNITLSQLAQMFGQGRFATVTFIKKGNGQLRMLNGKTKVEKAINGNGTYNASSNNQLRVFDVNVKDENGKRVGGYRTVTVDNVVDVRANGVIYKISGTEPQVAFITDIETLDNGNVVVTMFGTKRYEYRKVYSHVADAFRLSEDKGKFFNMHIKGRYDFVRLADVS